ncbi:hypothetical protein [Microbacterium murale]|uniref:Uncharacterized protein n=1 Tax=Microbacterium murale TaxID=1081040 RepID=A0ABU0PFV3_9MICO|nr:hypothetical protein [Microbacterium murale]MDQ0645534.1 hypothetical protein [Microbacterium murale]
MTVNLTPPKPVRMFNGPLLRDMLDDHYVAGIAAVYRLEPARSAQSSTPPYRS